MASIPVETLRGQDALREGLMRAIEHDDAAQIRNLVQRGAPLYPHYHRRRHPGHPSADPGCDDSSLVNPVDWAALGLRFRAAMQILELGDERLAHTEARPRPKAHAHISLATDTKAALNVAACHGHLGLMRMLLERGACVDQPDFEGLSCLHVAVRAGQADAVALLLQYAAWDVERRRGEVLGLARSQKVTSAFVAAGIPLERTFELAAAEASQAACAPPMAPADGQPGAASATAASAGARRHDWMQGGPSHAVLQGLGVQSTAVSPKPDGIVDWGWAPFQALPSTPLSAAGGGAVTTQKPGQAVACHELSTAEAKLRGELARAIRKGETDVIRGLVHRGAPLEAAFDLGYGEKGNCVDWACVSGRPGTALEVLELADGQGLGDALAVGARAALFWSVSQGYAEVLRELLRRGADVGQHSPLGSLKTVAGESLLAAAVFGLRKAETLELLKYGAWEKEPESQREQLLAWASARKPVAEAFQEAGVCDFSAVLAPLDLPFRDHGIWEPDYPPAQARRGSPAVTLDPTASDSAKPTRPGTSASESTRPGTSEWAPTRPGTGDPASVARQLGVDKFEMPVPVPSTVRED